jgi:hypothetical protein
MIGDSTLANLGFALNKTEILVLSFYYHSEWRELKSPVFSRLSGLEESLFPYSYSIVAQGLGVKS